MSKPALSYDYRRRDSIMAESQRPGRSRAAEQEWRSAKEQPCQWPDCHGHSCQGGNFKGCERAGEMAVAVPSDSLPNLPWWRRLLMRVGY